MVRGPEFMWKHESNWLEFPSCTLKSYDTSMIGCEIKLNHIDCDLMPEPKTALSSLLTRFSTFERLQRAVAWILRFKHYMKWKFAEAESLNTGCLTVSELNASTLEICKLMQLETLSGRYRAICVNLLVRSFARLISRPYCTVS